MTKISSKYLQNLRTESTHIQSGSLLITDAPTDNNGKGAAFSPTDLLATALGSCMMTIMGIWAEKNDVKLTGVTWQTTKIMANEPRKVGAIHIEFFFPKKLQLDSKTQQILQNVAKTCPVALSLHPDIEQKTTFRFDVE